MGGWTGYTTDGSLPRLPETEANPALLVSFKCFTLAKTWQEVLSKGQGLQANNAHFLLFEDLGTPSVLVPGGVWVLLPTPAPVRISAWTLDSRSPPCSVEQTGEHCLLQETHLGLLLDIEGAFFNITYEALSEYSGTFM